MIFLKIHYGQSIWKTKLNNVSYIVILDFYSTQHPSTLTRIDTI